jgi:Tol biopolymer transport system component
MIRPVYRLLMRTMAALILVCTGALLLVRAIAPKGEMFAYAASVIYREPADIYLQDFRSGLVVNLTRNPANDLEPVWSRDGRWLAFSSDRDQEEGSRHFYRLELATGRLERLTTEAGFRYSPAWSPDGQQIVFIGRYIDGDLYRLNLDTRTVTKLLETSEEELAPTWSPHGTHLAYIGDFYQVYIIPADGSDAPSAFHSVRRPSGGLQWSPDGQWLIVTQYDSLLLLSVTDPRAFPPRALVYGSYDYDYPSWLPDSQHILYTRFDPVTSVFSIEKLNITTGEQRTLTREGLYYTASMWRP